MLNKNICKYFLKRMVCFIHLFTLSIPLVVGTLHPPVRPAKGGDFSRHKVKALG